MSNFNTATGNDTILLNGLPLNNFGGGKILEITWDNTLVKQEIGKNGNSVSAYTPGGRQAKAVLKVMRISPDDVILDSLLKQMQADPPAFPPITLTLAKRFGVSTGYNIGGNGLNPPVINVATDTMTLINGYFSKEPKMETDIAGDIEQSYIVYEMLFSNFIRIVT